MRLLVFCLAQVLTFRIVCLELCYQASQTEGITCSNMYGEAGGGEGEGVTRGQESRT
jgi:hypothetical protein